MSLSLFSGTPALSYIPELDDVITDGEVNHAILSIKDKGAPRFEGMPADVYIIVSFQFLQHSILRSGSYPTVWSTGIITPIHKCGSGRNYQTIVA